MGVLDGTPFVERLTFFNGQQLVADDLQGLEALDREMRWLHNRSLHQPGIGNGFAVSGAQGDREVTIQPGYAVDALGREVVLLQSWVEAIPPVASEPDGQAVLFDLTVSYPPDRDLEEAETRQGICHPRGAVRLRERPTVCWVRLRRDARGQVRPVDDAHALALQAGMMIALARAEVLSCKLNGALVTSGRRNARPARQPFVAAGNEVVVWEAWTVDRQLVGVEARVNTSAGFRVTPTYHAQIRGIRPLTVSTTQPTMILDGPVYVEGADLSGFACHVAAIPLFSRGIPDTDADKLVEQANAEWSVTWLGIED